MPNLVGIGNRQVPTNAMLGGLAYQDSVGEINLDKIKAKTIGTAIDIFVYDTRKDSDGGAWRHRTQNKSWYNEGASQYRGARKEFPSIAVLVLEANYLKIYDGDDPNLSMWMVFNSNANSMCRVPSPSSVAMLNAKLVVGEHNNYAGSTIDFIMDSKDVERDLRQVRWNGNIASRNDTGLQGAFGARLGIGQHTNDVAMILLPNAPIDQVTGLPIPTIAVATDQGFTVIKDTTPVTVAHKQTTGDEGHQVAWLGTSKLVATSPTYYGIFNDPLVHESSDLGYLSGGAESAYSPFSSSTWRNTPHPIASLSTNSKLITIDDRTIVATTSAGLNIHELSRNSIVDNNDGMVAFITKDYNTGWQIGDIKGTFMSSTDDTNVTGELINLTNGEAATGQEGNFSSISANSLVAGTTSDTLGRYNTGTDASVLVNGKQYLATLTISNYSGSGDLGVAAGAGFDGTFRYSANGTYYKYISYTSGEVQLFYRNTNTATIGISLKEVDIDRSVNNKGLGVFGTINKNPVVTGAELVAYSGFSASNYLQQAINSDLQFGTGDWAFYGWYNDTDGSGARTIFELGRDTVDGDHIGLRHDGSKLELFISDDSFSSQDVAEFGSQYGNVWQFACAIRRGNKIELWKDGELRASTTITNVTGDLGDSETYLRFGNRTYTSQPWDGSLALWRVSKTALSSEQIKKIYYDEKCLFHEKAKCTLHGTSDDVKTVAFDDTSNILHVGTSGGRSDFRGLNRINNTTTAVTTAISASNELVAEQ